MAINDKHYLKLQYWNKIFRKNAKEFQTFFEGIMKAAYGDSFDMVKPYGNMGDKKNDGFRKKEGIYYQVYAPEKEGEKEAVAAKKLKTDFKGLYDYWQDKFPIKQFHFVFNNKDLGAATPLWDALAKLKKEYPGIEFDIMTPDKLENILFSLSDENILYLGFTLDARQALSNANNYLKSVEIDVDRSNIKLAQKALEKIKPSIEAIQDDELKFEFDLLQARAYQISHNGKKAKEIYKSLAIERPSDVRPILYLAEIYLDQNDFEKNLEQLQKAEKIDGVHWLLKIEKLIREYRMGNLVDASLLDEKNFPDDKSIKSIYYRLSAIFAERAGDFVKANSLIDKALSLNPDKFSNYNVKLNFIEREVAILTDCEKQQAEGEKFLNTVISYIEIFNEWGGIEKYNKIVIEMKKLSAFRFSNKVIDISNQVKKIFELTQKCKFNITIDNIYSIIINFYRIPDEDFNRLLNYIIESKQSITDELANSLFLQFTRKEKFITEGKEFFKTINNERITKLIDYIQAENKDEVLKIVGNDVLLLAGIVNVLKDYPNLRENLIKEMPEDERIDKNRIWVLFYNDTKQNKKALEIIKSYDLADLNYLDFELFLEVAHSCKAWELEIKILNRMDRFEADKKKKLSIKLKLLNANYDLKNYLDVISIGKDLLQSDELENLMDKKNKEALLYQIIDAHIKRDESKEALSLLEQYKEIPHTFSFKLAIETDVYLKNNMPENALVALVEGVKLLVFPTPEQYGYLYLYLTQISQLLNLSLDPIEKVENNSFVKFKNQDRWYFIGNDSELDAVKVDQYSNKYAVFIDKKVGDIIAFPEDKYKTVEPRVIENILFINEYIFYKSINNFQKLSIEDGWDAGFAIEVPEKDGNVKFDKMISFMEDQHSRGKEFFEMYCQNNYPFAFLAVSEGGVENAIGKITQENKGFIRLSSGSIEDIKQQKEIARKIINGTEAYLDCLPALFLSEYGMLEKIYKFIPNLKTPQSVINFLFRISERFNVSPGQVGHMGYAQGRIVYNEIDRSKYEKIKNNIKGSIQLLESRKENIVAISKASKIGVFTEQKIMPELCDACVLSELNKGSLVITDDYFYLQANALETKKEIPPHTSSFILVKVLYEEGKISFSEYLEYFGYLSSYRCRFLDLSIDDLIKAILDHGGEKDILMPVNLCKFNLRLVLSEEYGVAPETSLLVAVGFINRVILNNGIPIDIFKEILSEIIPAFLSDKNKIIFGNLLFETCIKSMEQIFQRNALMRSSLQILKLELLKSFIDQGIIELEAPLKTQT